MRMHFQGLCKGAIDHSYALPQHGQGSLACVLPKSPDSPACLANPAAHHLDLRLVMTHFMDVLTSVPSDAHCIHCFSCQGSQLDAKGCLSRGIPPPHPVTGSSLPPCKMQHTHRPLHVVHSRTFQVPWLRTWP